jgi:hypothetical protein
MSIVQEKVALAIMILHSSNYIEFINVAHSLIWKPWQNEVHKTWFNLCKKMYLMNNTVIGDHRGLFIYMDVGYSGLYHDVIILCILDMHKNWHRFCVHEDEYFE